MKRQTKKKANVGPKNPKNRKEAREASTKFISDCEQSLIKVIDETARECKGWEELDKAVETRINLLKKTYYDRVAKVILAANNVRRAYFQVKCEMLKDEGRV